VILTGPEIQRQVELGRIRIEPFAPYRLSPNSYDFLLDKSICWYEAETLDCRRENRAVYGTIPPDGMVLYPNRIYLGCTAERMGSDHFVPIIRARSSVARLGLFVHVTADLIDIGSFNQWTLQLHAVQPVRVYPAMRVGQVTFWHTHGNIVLYAGKYQNATGPRPSLIHRDIANDWQPQTTREET
jgi:dCTP deaminase